jgi:hypothetical protein
VKRWLWIFLPVLLLCGCSAEETMETVADEWMVPAMAQPQEIALRLPENMVMPVLEQEGHKAYLGDDYEIMVETMDSGDLDATIRSLTGYEIDRLTVIRTVQEDVNRYDYVWTAAGEQGERLGRGAILDDGTYHYCLSVLRDAEESGIVWQDVFGSFRLT